jgi:hypothetical protein
MVFCYADPQPISVWPFYEQAVTAALDVGDFRLADVCSISETRISV